MTVLDALLAGLADADAPVRRVVVGAYCTAVSSARCGLASTVTAARPHDAPVRGSGRLHHQGARELADYARSGNPLEASIGVAALASLTAVDAGATVTMNALELLAERGAGKDVVLIGAFPFAPRLRPLVGDLRVIDLEPADGEFPASAADILVPSADVVGITGSTLINHTLDGLLSLCRPGAFVALVGPSAPFSPVVFDFGVSAVAGAQVLDEEAALEAVGQGASFRNVPGVRRAVLLRR